MEPPLAPYIYFFFPVCGVHAHVWACSHMWACCCVWVEVCVGGGVYGCRCVCVCVCMSILRLLSRIFLDLYLPQYSLRQSPLQPEHANMAGLTSQLDHLNSFHRDYKPQEVRRDRHSSDTRRGKITTSCKLHLRILDVGASCLGHSSLSFRCCS